MTKVAQHKIDTVADFTKLIDEYPIVGVVNMKALPTKQMQTMRINLRGMAEIKMTKKRLMSIAFKSSHKKNIEGLKEHMSGMPALIFSKENPFKLYKILQKNKSNAPAKAGQVAPKDITVKAGPTGFTPGPIIGQLGKFGIKTGVEAGKLTIKEDKVVAKKGDVITAELAEILTRLNIQPMEIGLDLVAVYENETIYLSETLSVDEVAFMQKMATAVSDSMALSIGIGYPTKDNIGRMLAKAYFDSKSLAKGKEIITDDNLAEFIAAAEAQASALSSSASGEAPAHAGPKQDKPKKEEKKEEESAAGLGMLFG